jgi:hypothetical protein
MNRRNAVAPEQVTEAEALLRSGTDLDATCEALDISRKTLERAWVAKHGATPARWVRENTQRVEQPRPAFFRLTREERTDLDNFAEEDGVEPNAWAREAVRRALARRRSKP